METFGKFVTVILVMILTPIIRGFVLMTLWAWFVAPTFSLPNLSLAIAVGIMFLWTFLTVKMTKKEEGEDYWKSVLNGVVFTVLGGVVTLGAGWIVTLFI